MGLAVVGSIAFDSVKTPFGEVEAELGGSATHAALAAARFTEARAVAPVGEDFSDEHYAFLEGAGVETSEVPKVRGGRTMCWRGHYEFDMSTAHTDETELNVFEGWQPRLSEESAGAAILFLAAMDPEVQADVRSQWHGAKWSALDTIGYWIDTKRDALVEAIRGVDLVLMNDQEARKLTDTPMLLHAAREIRSWGPQAVVLKLGEYGCALLHEGGYFSLPGYPLEQAADPTGTGDSFAGGFLGYLDLVRGERLTPEMLRRAVTYGSTMASYCVEDFGARRIARLGEREIDHRFHNFKQMTHFEQVPTEERPREEMTEPHTPRFEMPKRTPSMTGYEGAPAAPAGTRSHNAPARTPSTERPGPTPPPAPPPQRER